jgi:hypothetical protein
MKHTPHTHAHTQTPQPTNPNIHLFDFGHNVGDRTGQELSFVGLPEQRAVLVEQFGLEHLRGVTHHMVAERQRERENRE